MQHKTVFQNKLAAYKASIDEDITAYSKQIRRSTLNQYGTYARLVTDVYLSILERGGKRIRGSLVIAGYEMSGGKDREMIVQAARAIEMTHAYILIIDDIQDRSVTRRNGPTAHVMLADYHRKHELAGDSEHFGRAQALNAALTGNHAAQMILANLNISEELRLNVISIMNRTMLVTAHGQTNDIMNEAIDEVNDVDVDHVMDWKTAHYSFLNPLHVGMVLAGADCHDTDAITDYAMQVGRAFQITDDILGTFGSETELGKSSLDDFREGKRTILTVHALQKAKNADKNFLIQMLGNRELTHTEFDRCKEILISCGALAHAQSEAEKQINLAVESLYKHKSRWSVDGVYFLENLAKYLLNRNS